MISLKNLEDKERLYNKYYFLIFKVIKDLHCEYRNEEELEEYIYHGKVGLLNAINTFKGEKETSTYFYTCIKNRIAFFFKRKDTNKRKINYLYKDSLDDITLTDSSLYELIPDENVNIEEEIIKKDQISLLYKAIDMLKPTYKDIICYYYGIYKEQLTLTDLAKKFNVSRQAINIKKQNAIKELRKNMRKLGGLDVE